MATITAAMVKELREITGAAMMDCKKALGETDGNIETAKEFLRKKGQASADKKSSRETKEGAVGIAQVGNKAALIKIACETDFVAINDGFQDFVGSMAAIAADTGIEKFGEASKADFVTAISKMGENMVFVEGQAWESDGVVGGYIHGKGKIGVMVELSNEGADAEKAAEAARGLAMHIAASHVEAISADDLDPAVLEKEKTFLINQAKESGKSEEIAEKMVVGRMNKFKKEICLLDQKFVREPEKSVSDWLAAQAKDAGGTLKVTRYFKSGF